MKNILIVGARGYGREIYSDIINYKSNDYFVKGFLDDKEDALKGYENYPAVLSSVEDYQIEEGDWFVCALGNPLDRIKYINIIKEKGGSFLSLIDPTCIIDPTARIGEGVIIGHFCTISADAVIGSHTSLQAYSTVGHDAVVGVNCSLGAYTFLGGFTEIGDNVLFHTRSTILPRKKVDSGATIGAGSVIIRNVKANTTVFGNPAREI